MNMTAEVWDKQQNETARAYAAFCVYRDLGAGRSLAKVRIALGKESGYDRQLEKWSSNYTWVVRAAAYDAYLEAKLREALEARRIVERRKQVERELGDADRLYGRYDDIFDRSRLHVQQQSRIVDELDDEGKPTGKKIEIKTVELNIDDWKKITEWLENIHKMKRLALGMPQRSAMSQVTGHEGGPIQVQWVDAVSKDDDIGIGADELT